MKYQYILDYIRISPKFLINVMDRRTTKIILRKQLLMHIMQMQMKLNVYLNLKSTKKLGNWFVTRKLMIFYTKMPKEGKKCNKKMQQLNK